MVALPEMFLTGYQTQDLVLKPAFARHAMAAVDGLGARTAPTGRRWGSARRVEEGGQLYNVYYILQGGRVHGASC